MTARNASSATTFRSDALTLTFDELDDFFEHAAIPLHWVGPDGTILRANRAELSFLGYAPEAYVGRNIAEFHADASAAAEIMRRLAAGEVLHNHPARMLASDGSTKHVLIDSSALFRDGEFVHTRCFTRDNAAQSELDKERALAEFNADIGRILTEADTLDVMLQGCAAALVTHLGGAFGRIWTLNEAEDVLELRASAGLYTHLDGAHGRVPVGSLKIGRIAAQRAAHITNSVADDPSISDPEWARREGMVAFAGHPLIVGERLLGVMALFSREPLGEMTLAALASGARMVALGIERARRGEQLIRQAGLLEQTHDAVIVWNLDEGIEYWNRAAAELYGYRRDEVLGRTTHELLRTVHPLGRDAFVAELLATGEWTGELAHTRKDGAVILVESRHVLIREQGGRLTVLETARDVSDRKRSEDVIKASEERWRTLTASLPAMVATTARDGSVDFHNERWLTYTGLDAQELRERWGEIVHPEDVAGLTESWQRAMAGQAQMENEYRARQHDGAYRWLRSITTPVMGDDGAVSMWIDVGVDVDDRKRADAALQLAHDRLSAIFDSSPVGIFSMDADLRVTTWSAGAERITGWQADEVLGERPRHVPDELWSELEGLAERARNGERVRAVETRRRHKSGALIDASVSLAAIYRPGGTPYGYVAIVEDVTARKTAEDARKHMEDMLRRVADASLDVNASLSIDEVLARVTTNAQEILNAQQAMTIAVFDGDWTDATVSVAFSERYAAWRDREVVVDGHALQRAVCEANRAVRLSRAELAEHPAWGRLTERADTYPPLSGVLAAPLIALDGRNLGLVQLSDKRDGDFTAVDEFILLQLARLAAIGIENARLYEEQQRTAEGLARANAVKDEFLGLVSHELRTPITTIYGNARVLRQQGAALDEADRAAAMADIETEADRLQRIIENLLILARFDATQAIETEPVRLESCIRVVADAYVRNHPARRVEIEIGDGVTLAEAQPTYLELVLGNLISNADKYSTSDTTIEVKAWRDAADIRVVVLDRGSGVIPEEVAELFSPFYRAGRTISDAPGMGIGLAVCKRIMEAQGAEIWAKPREGGGAEFGFSLRPAPDSLDGAGGGPSGIAARVGGATRG